MVGVAVAGDRVEAVFLFVEVSIEGAVILRFLPRGAVFASVGGGVGY